MLPEEKFAIEKPSQKLLDELGELVDQIERFAHQKARYADQLDCLNSLFSVATVHRPSSLPWLEALYK